MKTFLIILFIVLLLVPVVMGGYLIIFNCFYRKYFSKKGEFLRGQNKKYLVDLSKEDYIKFEDFEDIKCLSCGFVLRGKFKKLGNDKLVILSHTFGCDHKQMAGLSQVFMNDGFDVLAIDLPAHGESDGECTYGENESMCLVDWVKQMLELNSNYRIVFCGIGLGGASQLLALDRLPQNVKIIFCESSFSSCKKELSYLISKSKIKPPKKLFFNYLKRTKEINLSTNKILSNIKNCLVPVVIFHDEKDKLVPIEMGYSLKETLPSFNKEMIILKDCDHGEGIKKQEYLIKNTIKKYLIKYGIN